MNFKLAVLDRYDLLVGHPEADRLFSAMLKMRIDGYRSEYPENYLFMDSTDFVCRHLLVCTEDEGFGQKLVPIAGFRNISLERLDFFGLEASQMVVARQAVANDHIQVLGDVFDWHRRQNRPILSTSRLCIAKQYRSHSRIAAQIMEYIIALFYNDHVDEQNASCLGSGVLRFKSDRLLSKIGFVPLVNPATQEHLPPINLSRAFGDQTLVMLLKEMSDWSKGCASKYSGALASRLIYSPATIDSLTNSKSKKRAA